MSILALLLFILPLGLDTLGVSFSLGMKSRQGDIATGRRRGLQLPEWLVTAILFAIAETSMPLLGLAIGYATSSALSYITHFVGPVILIGIGVWELFEEGQKYFKQYKSSGLNTFQHNTSTKEQFQWRRQLLLALSISLDELAIGFSLGTIAVLHESALLVYPIVVCILIGIQGFLMTLIGITLGRKLKARLKNMKALAENLSAFLLIGLGVWLLVI